MAERRRVFDGAFKLQVARMFREQGLTVAQVCPDLDLGENRRFGVGSRSWMRCAGVSRLPMTDQPLLTY